MNCCLPSSSGLKEHKISLQSNSQMTERAWEYYQGGEFVFPVKITELSANAFPKYAKSDSLQMTAQVINENVFVSRKMRNSDFSYFEVFWKDRFIGSPIKTHDKTIADLWKYCKDHPVPNGEIRVLTVFHAK